ncbi:unnamed protein product [Chrysoparadoxa australica]
MAQEEEQLLRTLSSACPDASIQALETEVCYNIELSKDASLTGAEKEKLLWLVRETFEPEMTSEASTFGLKRAMKSQGECLLIEVGPRLSFESAFSSNAKSISAAVGIKNVLRLVLLRRFLLRSGRPLTASERDLFLAQIHDKMTETEYVEPLDSFQINHAPEPVEVVDIMGRGRAAIEEIDAKRGLGFDEWDLGFYTDLFRSKLKRNPTDVELFDMGQANSEHSRHWFFGGKMVIDGVEQPSSLFKLVKDTLTETNRGNSVIAFHDNSSAIHGAKCNTIVPETPGTYSSMVPREPVMHPILTAETHNFPSGVAPFPGAETGTGGRLRDVMATGRGARPIAGISSYCVGNLRIPGYIQPWEEAGTWEYASNLASPLSIEIDASNGASDYGNKFGEPVVHGFTRSFGQRLPHGERYEYVKPIMFSAGIGQMDALHAKKDDPEPGMWVVKIGGPAYRIGLGGGAASSRLGDASTAALDFNAVQRGDAEMENKLNRLMRACCDLGKDNPIVSVHDQGAGRGNGNVLKEIVEPFGAKYDIRNIKVGDDSMSVLEIWGAEYQENNALLVRPEHKEAFAALAAREKCPCSFLGQVTDDGRVTVTDSRDGSTPYDLPLSEVLGDLPQKTFTDDRAPVKSKALNLPKDLAVSSALDRVLRLLSVGSKRFLTNKVDRSVTGLVAQQQCVGPLQTPLANCAVIAQSHQVTARIASACGEQPIKGLVDPAAMARLTLAESLTNLMWAKISGMNDIKASGNWMWASKLPGECAKMWDACSALREVLLQCDVGVDGGKDSLSMAAKCGDELVKSPGTLVMTLYVTCPDVTLTVTPDLKLPGTGKLLYVNLSGGNHRLGGSALAQVYSQQVGDSVPDLKDFAPLVAAFKATQGLLDTRAISAGHDRSDGGLITLLLEMAFAGNCGISVDIPAAGASPLGRLLLLLFSEEVGFVLEVSKATASQVIQAYADAGVTAVEIGDVASSGLISVSVDGVEVVKGTCSELRDVWEATSFELEKHQTNPACVAEEQASLSKRSGPSYELSYVPHATPISQMSGPGRPKVCVLRQEGSNGDREMLSAFYAAGLDAWDVNMMDLLSGLLTLDRFAGIVFVGGFSYADVLDSGKGWAGSIKFNERVRAQFDAFKARTDTFSLGVCNGCQLMALLGWVPQGQSIAEKSQPRQVTLFSSFVHNTSGRFESRWSTVHILESPSVLLKGMAGSTLGVWVAHGEGRALFPDKAVLAHVKDKRLAPMRYVDDCNRITESYPFNPNGSVEGITALCSEDGRHLAMMPHPERCFLKWQWPHMSQVCSHHRAWAWLNLTPLTWSHTASSFPTHSASF